MPPLAPTPASHDAFRPFRWAAALPPLVVFVLLLTTAACRTEAGRERPAVDSTDTRAKSLTRLLREEARIARFAEAVDAAGFADELSDVGPYTVFAPIDDALRRSGLRLDTLLAAEEPDTLRKIVAYHLARGRWTASRVADSLRIATLLDAPVLLQRTDDSAGLRVDRRDVLATIPAQNGVLHLVGGVLTLPVPDTSDAELDRAPVVPAAPTGT